MSASFRRALAAVSTSTALVAGAVALVPGAASAATTVGTVGGISVAQSSGPSSVSDPTAATSLSAQGDMLLVWTTRDDTQPMNATIDPAADVVLTEGADVPLALRDTPGGVDVSVWTPEGNTCTPTAGTLHVLELTRDEASAITSFAADWQGTCTAGTQTISTSGQVRWNANAGFSGLQAPAAGAYFGQAWVGDLTAVRTVTWTAKGTMPVTVPAARLQAEGTPWFVISRDGCAGQTLQPGQTCSVSVKAAPRSGTSGNATLQLGDGASGPAYGAASLAVEGMFGAKGTYRALVPQRILDTRKGLGARKAVVGPGGSVTFTVLGRGGVPASGVSAVVLNLTAVGTTSPTYLTAYPAATSRPTTSSLNAPKGFTGANTLTVRPGAGGAVTVYNSAGSVNVLADVSGFYRSVNPASVESDYVIVAPERVVDTRKGGRALRAGYWMDLDWGYDSSVGYVNAYALNVTVTGATGPGYLTVWSGVEDPSTFSTLNFAKGSTRSNTVVAQAHQTQRGDVYGPGFGVFNGMTSGSAHVIVDVVGVYAQATHGEGHLRYRSLASPVRILDSRRSLGAKPWTAASTRTVTAPTSVAGRDTYALVGNATLVAPTATSYLTLFDADDTRPATSNVNAAARTVVANGATIPLGYGNTFAGYNSAGSANVLYDVAGTFELFPASYQALGGTVPASASGRTAASAGGERGQSLPRALPSSAERSGGVTAPRR